jgi:hypothetical protein
VAIMQMIFFTEKRGNLPVCIHAYKATTIFICKMKKIYKCIDKKRGRFTKMRVPKKIADTKKFQPFHLSHLQNSFKWKFGFENFQNITANVTLSHIT